jgi:putative Mn2+ efflux pump MntP
MPSCFVKYDFQIYYHSKHAGNICVIFATLYKQMDLFSIVAISLGLSFDTFAVSLSMGIVQSKIVFRQALRCAFVFAFFQGGLTIAGYFLGSVISVFMQAADHWVALLLLSFLGIKMIVEGLRSKKDKPEDLTKLVNLLAIAVGTSIDAFAVGISFAFLQVRIWESGLIIAIVTFMASMTAIRIGKSAGERLGQKVEIFGGLILIAIGLKIFIEHMTA